MTNCRAKMVEGFLTTPGLTCAFRVDLPGGRHRLRTLIAARNFETIQIKPFGLSELPFGGKRCPQEICSWKCQDLINPVEPPLVLERFAKDRFCLTIASQLVQDAAERSLCCPLL